MLFILYTYIASLTALRKEIPEVSSSFLTQFVCLIIDSVVMYRLYSPQRQIVILSYTN